MITDEPSFSPFAFRCPEGLHMFRQRYLLGFGEGRNFSSSQNRIFNQARQIAPGDQAGINKQAEQGFRIIFLWTFQARESLNHGFSTNTWLCFDLFGFGY